MKKYTLFIISFVLLFCLSTSALADGGFFRPRHYSEDIYEPTQKAIILFDGKSEQLIIEATYKGDMDEFAWIVPTPSVPKAEKSSARLFEQIHYLTLPIYKHAPGTVFRGVYKSMDALPQEARVNVLQQQQIGVYEVTVLSSDDPNALVRWLQNNSYAVSDENREVLKFYTDKGWYFTAMRINLAPFNKGLLSSLQQINSSVTEQNAVPLLTQYLVDNVKAEITYDRLTGVRTTTLEYDEEADLNGDRYNYEMRRERGTAPTTLIDESKYMTAYEQYNGYLEPHLLATMQERLRQGLEAQLGIPYNENDCVNVQSADGERYERCAIWYITTGSPEYQLLKDVECGEYCYPPAVKSKFNEYDLAKVAAYAAMHGDQNVKEYFDVTDEKMNWYDNDQDLFDRARSQIQMKLHENLQLRREKLYNELSGELITTYNQKTGKAFTNLDEIAAYFAQKTLTDLQQGKEFSATYATTYTNDFSPMSQGDYYQFTTLYRGDQNEARLRTTFEPIVQNVLTWKESMVRQKLGQGTIMPLSLTFATDEIIYPLKISSVNTGPSEILLYVFSNHRTQVENIEGFEVEYAKWIETDDVEGSQYRNLSQLLDDRYFLTKFRKEMWPKQMTDDLRITQAENDDAYRLTIYEKGYVLGWCFFIIQMAFFWAILFGLFFALRWPINFVVKKLAKDESSCFLMNWKRCAVYASIIIMVVLLAVFSPPFGRFLEDLGSPIEHLIYEPISHIFNFLGFSRELNALTSGFIVATIVFVVAHLLISLIVKGYRKVRDVYAAPETPEQKRKM